MFKARNRHSDHLLWRLFYLLFVPKIFVKAEDQSDTRFVIGTIHNQLLCVIGMYTFQRWLTMKMIEWTTDMWVTDDDMIDFDRHKDEEYTTARYVYGRPIDDMIELVKDSPEIFEFQIEDVTDDETGICVSGWWDKSFNGLTGPDWLRSTYRLKVKDEASPPADPRISEKLDKIFDTQADN